MQTSRFAILLSLLLTHFTLALPQNGPSYANANPLDEMDLEVYSGNVTKPCSGFLALEYASPLPVNATDCIAGIPRAPALKQLTCVTRKKQDARLNDCQMWGYLNTECSGTPTIAATNGTAIGAWVWGLGTGKTLNVQSFKVIC